MQNFNPDPKPGRLILPLVLIGMIATTYTFINRVATQNDLELLESEEVAETVSTEPGEETTTSTSTTRAAGATAPMIYLRLPWMRRTCTAAMAPCMAHSASSRGPCGIMRQKNRKGGGARG